MQASLPIFTKGIVIFGANGLDELREAVGGVDEFSPRCMCEASPFQWSMNRTAL
jgi:hypothetical protein